MTTAALSDLARFGPGRCDTLGLAAAQRYTDRFLRQSTENFTVASWLLPRSIRRGFADVYAFCRWADDLADDPRNRGDPGRGLEMLRWWRDELDRCYAGRPRHPVYVALAATVERHGLPREPFDDLIDAFEQDQRVTRYPDLPTLLRYCEKSANPVGRLVLMLMGYRDAERSALSDATCTALQLTNFWQDVRRDVLERDRVYLPRRRGAASRPGPEHDGQAHPARRRGGVRRLHRRRIERSIGGGAGDAAGLPGDDPRTRGRRSANASTTADRCGTASPRRCALTSTCSPAAAKRCWTASSGSGSTRGQSGLASANRRRRVC